VELFEQIRREYEHGGGTIRGIAKKLGIHRRMVREAVLSAVPIERKTPVRVTHGPIWGPQRRMKMGPRWRSVCAATWRQRPTYSGAVEPAYEYGWDAGKHNE